MEYTDYTPFETLAFDTEVREDVEYHVVVMRGTFAIVSGGELRPADDQEPLVMADEYFGEINKSSVKQESDLAPYKPECDVIIVGTAYAPEGKPANSFTVRARIAGLSDTNPITERTILEKTLTATGPRHWRKAEKNWVLTEPEAITTLPLRYEYSYGGECRINLDDPAAKRLDPAFILIPEQREQHPDGADHAPAAHTACETNPIGMGFMEQWYLEAVTPQSPIQRLIKPHPHKPQRGFLRKLFSLLDTSDTSVPSVETPSQPAEPHKIIAPQIESPDDRVLEIGKQYIPQGFSAITRSWQPRLRLAGTYDDNWLEGRWPGLPDDFDFAYWNCAHPDMRIPYPRGDEIVELTNLSPEGKLTFRLPGYTPYVLVRFAEGEIAPAPAHLDTMIIEPDRMRATLVWRTTLPVEPEVRVLEARLIRKEDNDELSTTVREVING